MDVKSVIKSQYYAALEMLRQAVIQCPEDMWHKEGDNNLFWHTAFHALFYTHFYLQPEEEDFVAWKKHREKLYSLSGIEEERKDELSSPYTKNEIIEYIDFCHKEVVKQVDALDLEAKSGFYWLPFNKLELQFYSIRHIQQHTGELYGKLEGVEGDKVKWVGMKK